MIFFFFNYLLTLATLYPLNKIFIIGMSNNIISANMMYVKTAVHNRA